ncbi:MFS transporter [Nocardiopsis ansamitocini]|uniref:MFS transporter n=1 Tax=Nocardiopsis ansamitocini TaxID=1670832 RepID=A0A9W6P877_9ACTN|nr:MFS transporter [Nocardiopsis ansamitocini]GLU48802.1 MFS transporter [Nocardiopsis ansamitocini]
MTDTGRRGPASFALDLRPLRHRPFRRLWGSTVVTAVGGQVSAVAVPVQVYAMTGSSTMVGLASLAGLVPMAVAALWGGSIADVVDRRTMMLVTNTGLALTVLALWVHAATGNGSVALLMFLVAVQQACYGANGPARGAAVARLVPDDLLAPAVALNTTVMQVGMVAGPLAAGALIPLVGIPALYLVDFVALALAVLAVAGLPRLRPLVRPTMRPGAASIGAGLKYIVANTVLVASFLLDIVAMTFGMPRAIFPELATGFEGVGSGMALGLLFAAIPAGAVLGGLLSGRLVLVRRHGRMLIGAVVAWGVLIALAGASHVLWITLLCLALAGVADLVSAVFRGTILQEAATDEMRGRIQGVKLVVVAGGPRVADALHGFAADLIGPRAAMALGGVLAVAVLAVLPRFLRALWSYTPAR